MPKQKPNEQVQQIPLSEIRPFKNHPFKVTDDELMQQTIDSIMQVGVLNPAIIRPAPEGGYEMVAGHRRLHAADLAGLKTIPAIVRNLDDDEAVILMVDSNLQRETISPMERAQAYKMKLEALKHQGKRTDLTSTQVGRKLESAEVIAQQTGESKNQVRRFIRLTELVPEIQEKVDSNPYSRWQQKQAIKKEYAAAKAGNGARNTVKASETTAKAAKRAAEGSKKAGSFFVRHKKGFLIAGGVAAVILLLMTCISSCSTLFQGGASGIAASTYPLEDADMLAAEAAYCAMEDELREYLNSYESTHDYDEYHFDLDEIEHDPYVLISMITALKGGEWTIDEIGGILETLFEKQYILTETVATETRYRTETHIGYYTDENGNLQSYEYEAEVPYTWYICHVELENFNLSHVPVHIMSHDQLSMYAVYMSVLGNRPDLFPGSPYVNRYYHTQYEKYEIPPEALADEQFAAIIKEAEKYLGYPYIWGGSSPATSFDCSGFVSYVYNNCGLHWSFGRLGAEGLRGMCAYVSPESARPGDLIFFEKTYDTAGASHVGIYVGNNRMLHCGDPIHYASIDTSYWRSHFLQFGRLP